MTVGGAGYFLIKLSFKMKNLFLILILLYSTNNIIANDFNRILAIPVAGFTSNAEMTCINHTVTLTDASTNTPTSWNWSFSPATVTYQNGTNANSQNPQITFNAAGTYDITLTATNASGSNAITKKNYVVGTGSLSLSEDFSVITPTDWAIVNPDNQEAWKAANVTGSDGNPTQAITMYNYMTPYFNQLDYLIMPKINLSQISNPQLVFEVAYAPASAVYFDRLYIDYSTDGGETYTATSYDKAHLDLATVGYDPNISWSPTAGDWRTETIDISGYSSTQTIFRIIQKNGFGNNLYIDNVRITGTILPVELTYFRAENQGNTNLLTWQTASEKNNQGFEIERSSDGKVWETIGFVQGNGTTAEVSDYEFIDNLNHVGFENRHGLYYRLKQVDFDGKYEHSNIVQLATSNSQPETRIFPNPATDVISIEIDKPTFIQIINSTGQILLEKQISNTEQLDVSHLSNGIYFLKTGQSMQQVIIQR
jgi:PKD repeat protein